VTIPTDTLVGRLSALLALFERGSLDLPEGALTHDTVFRLNGVAYDESLGRPAHDPIARLAGRGPGGYRFLIKALRFAIPDARIALGSLERIPFGTGCRLAGDGRLAGVLRGAGGAFDELFHVAFTFDAAGRLLSIDARMPGAALARIQAARQEEASA
jgi:hypothetical protein